MTNIYFIQLFGILLTAGGFAALTASAYLYGKPLSRDERFDLNRESRNAYRLPINLATVASAAFILAGIGILTWSKFDLCSYLVYWLPSLPDSIMFWLSCR